MSNDKQTAPGDADFSNYGSRFARDEEGRNTAGDERRDFPKTDGSTEPAPKGTPVIEHDAPSKP